MSARIVKKPLKTKEIQKKVKAVSKFVVKSSPAFSFFDYGLKMKESVS